MNKSDKNHFLANGGILLRKGEDRYGKPIIKARTKAKDWHPYSKHSSKKERDGHFTYLLTNENYKED